MSEGKALALVYSAILTVAIPAFLLLDALDANGAVYTLVMVALIGVGSDTITRVTTHYSSMRRER
jgi:hypothetical protein